MSNVYRDTRAGSMVSAMSDDTVTTYAAAVHAAARAMYLAKRPGHPTAADDWDSGRVPRSMHLLEAGAALSAALPLVRELIARRIEAEVKRDDFDSYAPVNYGLRQAAAIARGGAA